MARSADQIVDEIRTKRRRVREDLRALGSIDEVERRIRASPSWWIGGATLAGVIAARFFGPAMVRTGKRQLASAVWGRARSALFAAGVAAVSGRTRSDDGPVTTSDGSDSNPPSEDSR